MHHKYIHRYMYGRTLQMCWCWWSQSVKIARKTIITSWYLWWYYTHYQVWDQEQSIFFVWNSSKKRCKPQCTTSSYTLYLLAYSSTLTPFHLTSPTPQPFLPSPPPHPVIHRTRQPSPPTIRYSIAIHGVADLACRISSRSGHRGAVESAGRLTQSDRGKITERCAKMRRHRSASTPLTPVAVNHFLTPLTTSRKKGFQVCLFLLFLSGFSRDPTVILLFHL